MRTRTLTLAVAALLGAALAVNGLVMLVAPLGWYGAVPGVTATGPFNQHFVRDIGLVFVLLGAAFAAGIVATAVRAMMWGVAALWLSGHALFHVWEVAAGICGASVLARDFGAVSLPALVAVTLTVWATQDRLPLASRHVAA